MNALDIIASIDSLYDRYQTPLNVRRHMRLVAAVAEYLCSATGGAADTESIVAACLIHDLGNYVKMDFEDPAKVAFLDCVDQENLPRLRHTQKEFRVRYGMNDAIANERIIAEIGVPERITYLFAHKELTLGPESLWKNDLGLQIFFYADLRVAPHGVAPLEERLLEFQKRHAMDKDSQSLLRSRHFIVFAKAFEQQLFARLKMKPAGITNDSVQEYFLKY